LATKTSMDRSDLTHDNLEYEIIEDRMTGNPFGKWWRLLAAEEREGWRQRNDVINLLCSRRLLIW